MAINITHRPDLDDRVERLAKRLGISGYGRKTAVIEEALSALEERVGNQVTKAQVSASLNRYLRNGNRLRQEVLRLCPDIREPLSQALQEELYCERGVPRLSS
ncbi:MAG: hypothetical protein OXN89_25990 [Bryobacterales bacterium]|nr:hypothetical protein [Bryobacterales bacterium]